MPQPSNKHYEPGDAVLSTEQLNAVIDVVRQLFGSGGSGDGLFYGFEGGTFQIALEQKRNPIWGRLTDEDPSNPGRYSWREIQLVGSGQFSEITDRIPRKGEYSGSRPDWARDVNYKAAVPIGLPVLLMPMPPSVGGAAGNWMFVTPDLVQVVRFGSGPRSPWGDYDGYVMRFNGTDFVDSERVWLTVP